jgi:hypothetical protein
MECRARRALHYHDMSARLLWLLAGRRLVTLSSELCFASLSRIAAETAANAPLQPAQTGSHLHVGIGRIPGRLNQATTLNGLICTAPTTREAARLHEFRCCR